MNSALLSTATRDSYCGLFRSSLYLHDLVLGWFPVLAGRVKNRAEIDLAPAAGRFAPGDRAPLQQKHHGNACEKRAKDNQGRRLLRHLNILSPLSLIISQLHAKSDVSVSGGCPC